jgi:hypothetical protein
LCFPFRPHKRCFSRTGTSHLRAQERSHTWAGNAIDSSIHFRCPLPHQAWSAIAAHLLSAYLDFISQELTPFALWFCSKNTTSPVRHPSHCALTNCPRFRDNLCTSLRIRPDHFLTYSPSTRRATSRRLAESNRQVYPALSSAIYRAPRAEGQCQQRVSLFPLRPASSIKDGSPVFHLPCLPAQASCSRCLVALRSRGIKSV